MNGILGNGNQQLMASISRSGHLPISSEMVLATLTPPVPGYQPPMGRMDFVINDSDFSTITYIILADVTITHPNPSDNQVVTSTMLQPGYFSANRENSKKNKYEGKAMAIGARFVPLVLETYGSMSKSFAALLHSLSLELVKRSPTQMQN